MRTIRFAWNQVIDRQGNLHEHSLSAVYTVLHYTKCHSQWISRCIGRMRLSDVCLREYEVAEESSSK